MSWQQEINDAAALGDRVEVYRLSAVYRDNIEALPLRERGEWYAKIADALLNGGDGG
jgi:hypothetical protein